MKNNFFGDIKYITNLKNEKYEFDNADYILPYEILNIIVNKICNRLNHPVTIININYPHDCYKESRIDSDRSYFDLRTTCKNLRIAAGEDYCMWCDEYYAHYCKDLIEKGVCSYEPLNYFAEICKKKPPILQLDKDIRYLTYDCPMLGYCEMCYPIFFHENIIGFLVVGEVLLEDRVFIKQEIVNDFFEKQGDFECENNIFRDYYVKWKEIHNGEDFNVSCMKEDIKKQDYILEDFNKNVHLIQSDFKHKLTKEEFNDLIDKCCLETKKLEEIMKSKWNEKQQFNFEKLISGIREKFNQNYYQICGNKEISYTNIQQVFEAIWEAVIELKNFFPFDYCRLYDNLPHISRDYLRKLNEIGICPFDDKNVVFNFSKASLSMSQCKNSLLDKGKDNPMLYFEYDRKNDLQEDNIVILACENMAVLFGINSLYSLKINWNFIHFKILFKEITKLFLHMCADLDHISTMFIQQQHEKTLRFYRHECAHLALRIQHNNKYFSNRERYENLSPEKKENFYRDIDSVAILLQHLSTNIGLILGTIDRGKIRYSKIDVRNEFNKWRANFRLELRKKNLRLYNAIAPVDSNLFLNSDEELFGIMLFNLIDNAVKYSYWGTNIYVEVTPTEVIVRNYGIDIEIGTRPYDLYYRDEKNDQNHLGHGIGLFSAKKIADLLNLNLYHTCYKISDYNIPYVNEAYVKGMPMSDFGIDFNEALKQLNQTNRKDILTPNDYYDDFYLGKAFSSVTKDILYRNISKPTYCVTFYIKGIEMQTRED